MGFGDAPTTVGWRKDKDRETGEEKGWKLFGPSFLLNVGRVTVTKRDGESQEMIVARVSREFEIAGVMCRYGWVATTDEEAQDALDAQAVRDADPSAVPAAVAAVVNGWGEDSQQGWTV